MKIFDFPPLPHVYFGEGQLQHIGDVAARYGTRAMLLYGGGSIIKNGIYAQVERCLSESGITVVPFGGIEPNPRIESVRKGIELVKENGIDLLIPVGGGSTIDCSKAIAAGVYYDGDPWEMIKTGKDPGKALPIIAVLTIAATGSETNRGFVITNFATREKLGNRFESVIPKAAIMDPSFTFSVSKRQTACGIADTMAHVFEAYFSNEPHAYLQDRFSEAILKTAITYGPVVVDEPNNYNARAEIMWASSWALNGLTWNGKGYASTCHIIEHVLSAYYDITHADGLAILIPAWMRLCAKHPHTLWKFREYATNVWGLDAAETDEILAEKAIALTQGYFDSLGLPHNMRDCGISDKSLFEDMADSVMNTDFSKAFVAITKADVLEIFESCF